MEEEPELSSYWDNEDVEVLTVVRGKGTTPEPDPCHVNGAMNMRLTTPTPPLILLEMDSESEIRLRVGCGCEKEEIGNDQLDGKVDFDDMEVAGSEESCGSQQQEIEIREDEEVEDEVKDIIPSTSSGSGGVVQAIQNSVVHQICSGQVIVTLATGVKELVENALDAGSTSIEVKLVEYGSSLVQVTDNGSGVEEHNFKGLALKHHTSKLVEFEDLSSVETFGFRGEALSSLASICSSLTILTRCTSSKTGFRLEYDSSGQLLTTTPTARERGTTVALSGLFSSLPVRHAEFIKNRKREFHKLIHVLNAYALISKGVRMTVTHQHGNMDTFSQLISISSTNAIRERIVALFGSKQLSSLLEFEQEEVIDEETLTEFALSGSTFINDRFRVEGFISKPNQGRSSNDRQFLFINSRPCDLPKVSKIVNGVFHTFSRNQSPFVCLNILTERGGVDVNVTPDKRSLYLQAEASLLAILKASLTSLLTLESSSFSSQSSQQYFSQSQISFTASQEKKERSAPSSFSSGTTSSSNGSSSSVRNMTTTSSFHLQMSSTSRASRPGWSAHPSSIKERFGKTSSSQIGSNSSSKPAPPPSANTSRWITPRPHALRRLVDKRPSKSHQLPEIVDRKRRESKENGVDSVPKMPSSSITASTDLSLSQLDLQPQSHPTQEEESVMEPPEPESYRVVYDDEEFGDCYDEQVASIHENRSSTQLHLGWDEIKDKIRAKRSQGHCPTSPGNKSYAQKFHAKIAPGDNSVAEQELVKQLSKDSFPKMEIVGQFNLGFILAKLGSDLFIVDQHASDEKYNFEQLQKSTVLQTQRLFRPMELELPAVSENILLDHLPTFQRNGFDFTINLEAPPTKRIALSKVPFSKFTQFDKSDVEELLFMLEDLDPGSGGSCRPSKVRSMLASRACRKSVMIGTDLGSGDMRRIVDHMGTMDQPWNCPHGRPTIRHLFNTNLLPDPTPRSRSNNH